MLKFIKKIRADENVSLLAIGSMQTFVTRVAGLILGFLVTFLMARWMGAERYGICAYVLSIVGILSMIAQLGFQSGVVRFAAAYETQKLWPKLKGLLNRSFRLLMITSFITSMLGIIIVKVFEFNVVADSKYVFYIGFTLIPLQVLLTLKLNFLRAFRHIFMSVFPLEIIKPALVVLCIIILYWFGTLTPERVLAAYFLGLSCALILSTVYLGKMLPSEVRSSKPQFHTREWLIVSLPMLASSLMQMILNRTDTLMLGSMRGMYEVGIYSAAMRICHLVVFPLAAVNQVFAPMISKLFAAGKKDELQRVLSIATFLVFCASFPITLFILFNSSWIMGFLGPEYLEAQNALRYLLVGQVMSFSVGPVGFLLIMTGYQNHFLIVIAASAVANAMLNFFVIPIYGVEGAAVVTSVTTALWNILMVVLVRKKLGLRSYITFSRSLLSERSLKK